MSCGELGFLPAEKQKWSCWEKHASMPCTPALPWWQPSSESCTSVPCSDMKHINQLFCMKIWQPLPWAYVKQGMGSWGACFATPGSCHTLPKGRSSPSLKNGCLGILVPEYLTCTDEACLESLSSELLLSCYLQNFQFLPTDQ